VLLLTAYYFYFLLLLLIKRPPPLVFVMRAAAHTLDFYGAQSSVSMCEQREKEKTGKRQQGPMEGKIYRSH